jgi:hypothetical protein
VVTKDSGGGPPSALTASNGLHARQPAALVPEHTVNSNAFVQMQPPGQVEPRCRLPPLMDVEACHCGHLPHALERGDRAALLGGGECVPQDTSVARSGH